MHGSLSYARLDQNTVAVQDLDFAAYCRYRGLVGGDAICTAGRDGAPRRYLIRFHDPDDRVRRLGVDYLNSEAAQHADLVRRYKRICRIVPDSEVATSEMQWKSCTIDKE
jgi:hypothetical protein